MEDEETGSIEALEVPLAGTPEELPELEEFGELEVLVLLELDDELYGELVDELDDELNESLEEASSLSINNDESVIEEGCSLEEAVLEEEGELVESPEQRLEFSVQ